MGFLQFMAILCLLIPSLVMANTSVLIIKSSDNQYFNTSIERLIEHSKARAEFKIKNLAELTEHDVSADAASLIITLGHAAAKFTHEHPSSIPVIHSYLTEFQYHKHSWQKNHYTVLLEQPLPRYLKFIDLLLAAKKIAIIKTAASQISPQVIRQLQDDLQLNIDQHLYNKDDNPVKTLRKLLSNNDVLLSLPEPDVYNNKSLKGILLSSYRLHKPVISYSPAHVKSGALAAIYSSPADIGQQLAKMVDEIVRGYRPKKDYFFSDNFNVIINQQVAKSLGLKLPDAEKIVRQLKQSKNQ